MHRTTTRRSALVLVASAALGLGFAVAGQAQPADLPDAGRATAGRPDVVIITVDTLRYDRLSLHGYPRSTSPNIDRLMASGARFDQARVPEPLTAPSMVSMLTSLYPHDHGTSRNGLRMRPGVPSLARVLARRGYLTTAFIGNWTLKDRISGIGEHFEQYNEVFTRKRWGLWSAEATAEDLTDDARKWLDALPREESGRQPFLLWVHYVEPHAPYLFHRKLAAGLGIVERDEVPPSDRYDTEVAFVDHQIGQLLAALEERTAQPLIIFASDHGESLGEHNYWGHGRHLYDVTLRVPLSFTWDSRVEPQTITAPASLLDVAPTLFGIVGWPVPPAFEGFDWSPVMRGEPPPAGRSTRHQAHKGAVKGQDSSNARRQGLLEVGLVSGGPQQAGRKETLRTRSNHRRVFDLDADRGERTSLVASDSEPSEELAQWLREVREGLIAADDLPPPSLDEEDVERMRALGYLD